MFTTHLRDVNTLLLWGLIKIYQQYQQQLPNISRIGQLMVNGWFGLVVWDSRCTSKIINPFQKGIPGIQITGPQTNN